MSLLAIKLIKKHSNVFHSFDLVTNHDYVDLDQEANSIAVFNSLITLKEMLKLKPNKQKGLEIIEAIEYIKSLDGYYSNHNQ